MRVYISGPMTGKIDMNKAAFDAMAELIREDGDDPAIPYEIGERVPGMYKDWAEMSYEEQYDAYMKEDLREMLLCDAVVALPNWGKSKGARIEVFTAQAVHIPVSFQEAET